MNLVDRDLARIWHPCSQMKDFFDGNLPFVAIKRGEGIYIEDFEGNRYLDAISSWWVNLFGHSEPRIARAIADQASELEHLIFAGFTHEPAVRLAERITAMTGLDKVFFADNGSSAIEVAIKMAFHYFANLGEKRPLVVSLTNSYHGETLGALAVGDVELYKKTYEPLLIRTVQAKSPAYFDEAEALADMENILIKYKGEIASVIIEPLVQCAGNMAMYQPSYLVGLRELCDRYGVLLIADEIAVGFGRTGKMFAFDHTSVKPDIMTLSKGITGGFLPLALTVTTDRIYNAFYCDYLENRSFLHSHSYTGNPIACAAANATLDIFESDQTLIGNQTKIKFLSDQLENLRDLPKVANIRQQGMIAAFDIEGYKPSDRIGTHIYREAMKQGLLLRPLGNTVYFMPPYIITTDEICKMVEIIKGIVEKL